MPNIAALLKSEITRVARKEIRAEIESLRKAVSAQRLAIAALKREIAEVRKAASEGSQPPKAAAATEDVAEAGIQRRFSPSRLAAHRQKIGLSAAQYGALVGVTGQSIYKYEQGKARPHTATVRKLSEIKERSKAQILASLQEGGQG